MSRGERQVLPQASNPLRAKIARSGGSSFDEIAARAESKLAAMKDDIVHWLKCELEGLSSLALSASEQGGNPDDAVDRAFGTIHEIQGLAGTFKLELVTDIARSYCHFAKADNEIAGRRLDILSAHVDAMRAALHAPASDTSADAQVLAGLAASISDALAKR